MALSFFKLLDLMISELLEADDEWHNIPHVVRRALSTLNEDFCRVRSSLNALDQKCNVEHIARDCSDLSDRVKNIVGKIDDTLSLACRNEERIKTAENDILSIRGREGNREREEMRRSFGDSVPDERTFQDPENGQGNAHLHHRIGIVCSKKKVFSHRARNACRINHLNRKARSFQALLLKLREDLVGARLTFIEKCAESERLIEASSNRVDSLQSELHSCETMCSKQIHTLKLSFEKQLQNFGQSNNPVVDNSGEQKEETHFFTRITNLEMEVARIEAQLGELQRCLVQPSGVTTTSCGSHSSGGVPMVCETIVTSDELRKHSSKLEFIGEIVSSQNLHTTRLDTRLGELALLCANQAQSTKNDLEEIHSVLGALQCQQNETAVRIDSICEGLSTLEGRLVQQSVASSDQRDKDLEVNHIVELQNCRTELSDQKSLNAQLCDQVADLGRVLETLSHDMREQSRNYALPEASSTDLQKCLQLFQSEVLLLGNRVSQIEGQHLTAFDVTRLILEQQSIIIDSHLEKMNLFTDAISSLVLNCSTGMMRPLGVDTTQYLKSQMELSDNLGVPLTSTSLNRINCHDLQSLIRTQVDSCVKEALHQLTINGRTPEAREVGLRTGDLSECGEQIELRIDRGVNGESPWLEKRLESMWTSISEIMALKEDESTVNRKLNALHLLILEDIDDRLRKLNTSQ